MQFTDQSFEQEVEKNTGVVLVDFFATWCGPCQITGPIIEELATEYKNKPGVKIGKLNIDENQATTGKFGVMSIPAFILFKNGQIVERAVGMQSKESLEKIINKNL